jgi:hypothetical protein
MSRWHTTDFDFLPERAFQPRGGKFSGGMTLEGGGKGSSAPPPDPRMGKAALRQVQLAERQFEDYQTNDRPWMQGIANEAIGISRANSERANALSDYQLGMMKFNDDRWRTVGVGFENELLDDARRFDSDGYKQGLVTQAQADVGAAFDRAGEQNIRGMQRRSVNPNSGAMLALGNQNAIARATAESAAASKTRQAAEQIGLSTKMQMYGGMKGLAGLGNANAGLAMSGIGAAQGAAGGMTGAASGFLNANNAAFGSAMGGMSSGISGMGQYSQLQQNAAKINNDNDPFSTILGAATGVGTGWALNKWG